MLRGRLSEINGGGQGVYARHFCCCVSRGAREKLRLRELSFPRLVFGRECGRRQGRGYESTSSRRDWRSTTRRRYGSDVLGDRQAWWPRVRGEIHQFVPPTSRERRTSRRTASVPLSPEPRRACRHRASARRRAKDRRCDRE